MIYFDYKQKKLIKSWHNLSEKSEDPYMAYLSEWIAFNAICYNLYYNKASIDRANIDRSKSKLKDIHQRFNTSADIKVQNAKFEGTSEKWSIDLSLPERLFISVTNNYTEDIIYNEFVSQNQAWYNNNKAIVFEVLKNSLAKENGHYVINMAKSKQYHENDNIKEMIARNIIIPCEDNDLKTIKNVLYQIRCNIFHGEKTPGDINDDRIVKSALPILKFIVNHLIVTHGIDKM